MCATAKGRLKISISLAVQRDYNHNDVDYIDCVAWGRLADTINTYCRKGDKIAINGNIRQDNYTSSSGDRKYKLYVYINHMDFCGHNHNITQDNIDNNIDNTDDDLPW